ncbi:MAG: flagellar biosynthetic protein FliR [Gammaproteobacteria bacterium]|nr:flagellar biosynthetic protein FliR [Gammaproteobacteria bacterium]
MVITSEEITSWIGTYMWTLTRIAALFAVAPIFSSRNVPPKIKIGFAVVLTLVIAPTIPKAPAVDMLSGGMLLITLQQILIGLAMGLSMKMVFGMFVIGGQVVAYQMGLGFSQMVDPQTGLQVPVISQFYIVVLTLIFLAIDGHLIMIEVVAESFTSMPIAVNGISMDSMWRLVNWGSQMYLGGVKIALPAIAAILLINLTFGVVTRSAPQFNIFSVGFPITMVLGFFIIMATFSTMLPQIIAQISNAFELMKSIAVGAP